MSMTRLTATKFLTAPTPAPSSDWGRKPVLKWLATDSLQIDRAYQRDVLEAGNASIRRIVENFRWSRFGTLLVANRGGGCFAIVDGQHRALAAVILRIAELPCLVIEASLEEEAHAFAAINGAVTRPHALQIFHARAVAGDKEARKVQALCRDAGIIVPRNPGLITKVGETHSIGALLSAVRQHGDLVVGMALKAIVETGEGNMGMLKPGVIQGLADALAARKPWLRSQRALNEAIERSRISRMYDNAIRIRALDGGSGRALFAAQVGKALDRAA